MAGGTSYSSNLLLLSTENALDFLSSLCELVTVCMLYVKPALFFYTLVSKSFSKHFPNTLQEIQAVKSHIEASENDLSS